MSTECHRIDNANGVYMYADSRKDAWHQLGQQVSRTMTAEEVLSASHLAGWDVRKMPISIPQDPIITIDGVTTPPAIVVPDRYATVRTNPITKEIDYLGIVGDRYEPVQNEASCDLLNAIVDESGAHFETAGALYDGRQTFVTMKLPKVMDIAGIDGRVDRTEWYLAALNSHDGSSALRVILTGVRIVCANTQRWALKGAQSSFSVRHTKNAKANIAEARRLLGITWQSIGTIDAEFRRMAEAEMSNIEAEEFVRKLLKADDVEPGTAAATRRDNVANDIFDLFVSSETIAPVRGTRYALYNAFTEYQDHYAAVRGAGGRDADARALRTIRDAESETSLKARAFRGLQLV